jgi:hypothetical protein
MTWSGGVYRKGNFASNGWTGDAANSIGIEAGRHDVQDDDFANGINQCLTKDGSNSATADINFGGYKPSNIAAGTAAAPAICAGNDVNTGVFGPAADTWAVATNGTERLRVGTAINTTTALGINATPRAQFDVQTTEVIAQYATNYANVANGYNLIFQKSRGTTIGANTIVSNGDIAGAIVFQGANGTGYTNAAGIIAEIDGTPGASNDMPGRLTFHTTVDGSGTLTERMRIDSAGRVGIGTNAPSQLLHVSDGTSSGDVRAIVGDATNNVTLIRNGATDGWIRFNGVDGIVDAASNKSLIFRTNAAERMRILSNGVFCVGTGSSFIGTAGGLCVKGGATTGTTYSFATSNSADGLSFSIANDGAIETGVLTNSPYNRTTGSAANMFVSNAGSLLRSTSSLRYKTDVRDYTNGLSTVDSLRPVFYKGKNDGDKQFAGLIAEEVHEAGLTEFVVYNEQNEPDALHYGNMVALAFKAIQELNAKVETLESQVEMLQTQVTIG